MENDYNGWKNRDTWLVALWIGNTQCVNDYFIENKKYILNLSNNKANFKMFLRNVFINFGVKTDKIVYKNIDLNEIKNYIQEL